MSACRRITAGITMLTHLKNDIKVFAPFVLPQNNWSFDSGKTNGVMPAHVSQPFARVPQIPQESCGTQTAA